MADSPLDRVYGERAAEIRLLRPSCRSRALLPLADLIAFLHRLSRCPSRDRSLVVWEAPEVHCFLALQEIPKGDASQETNGLDDLQLRVIEHLCDKSRKDAPPLAACRKALRTIFLYYDSNKVSLSSTLKLLSECAKHSCWDIAKHVVGCLCAHLKAADLGPIEQKVLGALRDSLAPCGINCIGVLLEPLHKLIFLHFSSLMAQGTAPVVGNLPPAIKWYLRFLRRCVGNGVQPLKCTITDADTNFLFWPFIIPFCEVRADFSLQNQTLSREARGWSLRYEVEIKTWRDSLIEQFRNDLKLPKANGYGVACYEWLPFADYASTPDLRIWLHDLLSHSKGSVEDIESRYKQNLEISATGAGALGLGAALVEILAQEMRTCHKYHVWDTRQQSHSIDTRQEPAAKCCGCIQQKANIAGNAAALLIWLLRPDSMELCDSSWVIIINNLLLATWTTKVESAIFYHNPSGKHLADRVVHSLSHEDKLPLQATDSTFNTIVQNEKDFILNGANQLRAQAGNLAERSRWRLEELIWPALLSQMSCCFYSFTCHRVLESLDTFAPRCSQEVDDPFPLLHLSLEQFRRIVKRAPRFILSLMRFLKAGSESAAISCFQPGEREVFSNQDSVQLNLCALQEEEFVAAIHHCVLQNSEPWAVKQDDLTMQVAAYSGGSFRYLFGECEDSEKMVRVFGLRVLGEQSNSRVFGDFCAREIRGDSEAGLVAAIEGHRLLAWELRKWTEALHPISVSMAKKSLPELEKLKRIYVRVSALREEFPPVDACVAVGLSALDRFLRAQEEDVLWELEVQEYKDARSAKRPRLSSNTTIVSFSKSLPTEREDNDWIVEAVCRSPVSLEKYLLIYLGLNNDTKRGGSKKSQANVRKQKTPSEASSSHRQNLVSYLAKHPSHLPDLASLCRNRKILQVACEALEQAAASSQAGSDIFELWLHFLEKFREAGCNTRSLTYLHGGSLLARMTECALHHTTVISDWPQNLLENVLSVSPALVHRICAETRGHIESRLAANDAALKNLEVGSVDFSLSGLVVAADRNPTAVAQYLETTFVATYSNVGRASQSQQIRSTLLDLLTMLFALCKPESRTVVLSRLQESDLYKKSSVEGFDVQSESFQKEFVVAVVFWRSKVLKELKDIYVKHRASTMADAAEMDQFLSLSEQRAALCHVLVTSEPQLGGDQRAHTYGENASVSVEEMILQLQEFAPLEEISSLCHAIISWILLYCKMNIRLNLDHVGALCRLHPLTIRDALIKTIEAEIMEAHELEGKSGWKSSLEELKQRLLQGLLAWLPLEARSHFTTPVAVPSEFWLESNIKGVHEVISCLTSSDVGVRRSAFYLVVAHQHHHHFVASLTLELCNKAVSSELTIEQEALLGVLLPVFKSEPHKIVDPVTSLFRKAKELALISGAGDEGKNVTEVKQLQHVKALLRVGLLACEVSPDSFATVEIALVLAMLTKVEDPSEEIIVGAVQCLQVLALDLGVTAEQTKLVQDLLLHFVYKPAGDYVWHLAMSFAERFAGRVFLKDEANRGVKEEQFQELLHQCPLQRSIPLQALLKRLNSTDLEA